MAISPKPTSGKSAMLLALRNTNISSRGLIDSPYDASWVVGDVRLRGLQQRCQRLNADRLNSEGERP